MLTLASIDYYRRRGNQVSTWRLGSFGDDEMEGLEDETEVLPARFDGYRLSGGVCPGIEAVILLWVCYNRGWVEDRCPESSGKCPSLSYRQPSQRTRRLS